MRVTTFTIVLFLGLVASTLSQESVSSTDEVLQQVGGVVGNVPELKNLNTSALPIEQTKNLFKEKCTRNGGASAFENAEQAQVEMVQCLQSLINITELQAEMEKYKPTGDLDIVFKNYCNKRNILRACVNNFTNTVEHCLDEKERENKKIVLNITDSLLEFICYKEGDRIALFISAGGPECFQSKQGAIQNCANNTYGGYIPKTDPSNNFIGFDSLPSLTFGTKECRDITSLQACVVAELEKCPDPTPANIMDSIFNFVRRVTPCENILNSQSAAARTTGSASNASRLAGALSTLAIIPFIVASGKRAECTSDEDSVNNDACSETSGQSDNRSMLEDANDNEVDELAQQEAFEEKLKEAIDGLTQKSAKGRVICFNGIEKILAIKYIPDFVEDRKITITDAVERSLKKGRGDEQSTAARLSTLLCVQLGAFESAEMVCRDLKSTLTFIANDNTAPVHARAECCWALAMNQFLSGNDATDTMEIMQLLSSIFSGSYLKGNGAIANISTDVAALHAAAISSWTLLLTVITSADIYNLLASGRTNSYMPSLNRLRELLESPHLDVRLSAGEALAVIFELGRDFSTDYEQDWALDLVEILKELATDSNKYRAKKDRKQQRANFRDILRYIEEDIVPEMHVRFGKEILYLEGWCTRTQYNACCRLLGPGINIHLAENQLLREIFHLGNKVLPPLVTVKTSKLERTLMNAAAFKARTIQRNKSRDKRSPAMAQ
ncbi:Interferon-related developmental regulator 1 [Camponotus floridanus]|uniref:Interferon-related developmental regulator 1 n=1 Tax=Camponotus floridanus TaxID=104421 RepID=E2AMV6_CAMFO|nr:Interferon-related developmental regulator 1 [Camponotus floridanus]